MTIWSVLGGGDVVEGGNCCWEGVEWEKEKERVVRMRVVEVGDFRIFEGVVVIVVFCCFV